VNSLIANSGGRLDGGRDRKKGERERLYFSRHFASKGRRGGGGGGDGKGEVTDSCLTTMSFHVIRDKEEEGQKEKRKDNQSSDHSKFSVPRNEEEGRRYE